MRTFYILAISIALLNFSMVRAESEEEPQDIEEDLQKCESQLWTLSIQRYKFQISCDPVVDTLSDRLLVAPAKEFQVERNERLSFLLYDTNELDDLIRTNLMEHRTEDTKDVVCVFRGLTTRQAVMVIVQSFTRWLRFPFHFIDYLAYKEPNSQVVRFTLGNAEAFFAKFGQLTLFDENFLTKIVNNEECVAEVLTRFNLLKEDSKITQLSAQAMTTYIVEQLDKSFLEQRLNETCSTKMSAVITHILFEELKADVEVLPPPVI